jgi:hypothetical protein
MRVSSTVNLTSSPLSFSGSGCIAPAPPGAGEGEKGSVLVLVVMVGVRVLGWSSEVVVWAEGARVE